MVGVDFALFIALWATLRSFDFSSSDGFVKDIPGLDLFWMSFHLDLFVAIMILTDAAFPVRVVLAFEIIFFPDSLPTFYGCCHSLAIWTAIM